MNNTVYRTVDIRIDTQRRVTSADILKEFALSAHEVDFDENKAVIPAPGKPGYVRVGASQVTAERLQRKLGSDLVHVSSDFYFN